MLVADVETRVSVFRTAPLIQMINAYAVRSAVTGERPFSTRLKRRFKCTVETIQLFRRSVHTNSTGCLSASVPRDSNGSDFNALLERFESANTVLGTGA